MRVISLILVQVAEVIVRYYCRDNQEKSSRCKAAGGGGAGESLWSGATIHCDPHAPLHSNQIESFKLLSVFHHSSSSLHLTKPEKSKHSEANLPKGGNYIEGEA